MPLESGSEDFNILIEDLDIADHKIASKREKMRIGLLKCRSLKYRWEIITIYLIILVIAIVAIGKAQK